MKYIFEHALYYHNYSNSDDLENLVVVDDKFKLFWNF